MLKFITRVYYHDKINTSERKLFYKVYKWQCGLFSLIENRRVFGMYFFLSIGIFWIFFLRYKFLGLPFIFVGIILFCMEKVVSREYAELGLIGLKPNSYYRTLQISDFFRKYVILHSKALGKKEWDKIKEQDIDLYNQALSYNSNYLSFFYSLEIAKIISDSILLWGAIKDPLLTEHNYYSHAVILRNGYIYDSNIRSSVKYEDYIKLFKFKLYEKWSFKDYSKDNFFDSKQDDFKMWCIINNVSDYDGF